jgi:hypothetical protein
VSQLLLRLKLGSVWSTELRKNSLDVISFLECASVLDSLVFFCLRRVWSECVSWSVGHVTLG